MNKLITVFLLLSCIWVAAAAQTDTALRVTLPKEGIFTNDKPMGKGWEDLLDPRQWNKEEKYWQFTNGTLHGESENEKEHHYAYTNKTYKDFELNVLIKMTGNENANSGVCIRIHPTNFDNAPGYQVDMGKGYWGCLWEERRAEMVQKYPDTLAAKLVLANGWNHYYIVAKGHHIQAWLNGVKTIDTVHDAGFPDGNIGFQLAHAQRHTIVDVKALFIRELKVTNDKDWVNLLDHDLTRWENYLSYHHKASYNGKVPVDEHGDSIQPVGYDKNVNNVFSVIKEENDWVLKVTGEYYGCVFTKSSYKNFRLKVKVRWGTKKWEAREGKLMDAGILYYSQGPCGVDYWRAWMLSQEFQLMEGHFGDYWNIANSAIDIRAFMPEGSMSAAAGHKQPFLSFGAGTALTGYCMRTADYATPGNGWTEVELVCYDGKSLHIVNGHVVMVLSNSRFMDNGAFKPLVEGKIQLQSEGSEVYYKDIRIKEISNLPDEYANYFKP